MFVMLYTLATLTLQGALLAGCGVTLQYASQSVRPEWRRRNFILAASLFALFLTVAYSLPILHFPTV